MKCEEQEVKDMYFLTFQSGIVLQKLRHDGVYKNEIEYSSAIPVANAIERFVSPQLGYKPIFVTPIVTGTQLLADLLRVCCLSLSTIIIFKTDNYKTMNLGQFYKSVIKQESTDLMSESKFVPEYVVPEIRECDVLYIFNTDKLPKTDFPELGGDFIKFKFILSKFFVDVLEKCTGCSYVSKLDESVINKFFDLYEKEYSDYMEILVSMKKYYAVNHTVNNNYRELIDSYFKNYLYKAK